MLHSQEVQWASKVIGVSSEYAQGNGAQYRPSQLLGKPNKLPQGESGASAWRSAQPDAGEEWIKVGFETPAQIRQIVIAENYGAGCVTSVVGYDTDNKEYTFYKAKPEASKRGAGMHRIWLPQLTTFKVCLLYTSPFYILLGVFPFIFVKQPTLNGVFVRGHRGIFAGAYLARKYAVGPSQSRNARKGFTASYVVGARARPFAGTFFYHDAPA